MNKKNILLLLLIAVLSIPSALALGAETKPYVFEVGIPGIVSANQAKEVNGLPGLILQTIKLLYIFGAVFAFISLLIAGFQYITSMGNMSKTKDAMDRVKKALIGLLLLLGAYLILYTINPDLVSIPKNLFSQSSWLMGLESPEDFKSNVREIGLDGGDSSYEYAYSTASAKLGEQIIKDIQGGNIVEDSDGILIKDIREKKMDSQLFPIIEYINNGWDKPTYCGQIIFGPSFTGHAKRTDISGGNYDSCHEEGQGKAIDIEVLGSGETKGSTSETKTKCQQLLKEDLLTQFNNAIKILDEGTHIHIQTADCTY